jgi:hypothetical protein
MKIVEKLKLKCGVEITVEDSGNTITVHLVEHSSVSWIESRSFEFHTLTLAIGRDNLPILRDIFDKLNPPPPQPVFGTRIRKAWQALRNWRES